MLSQRQKKILLYVIEINQPVTATWIAKELGVSDRTIRNDIKNIQTESDYLGIGINLIRGQGYHIKVENKELFHQRFGELTNDVSNQLSVDFSEQEDRVVFILKQFLLKNVYLKLESFEDEMFVSKSTIQNDLKEVRKILSKSNLELVNRPHYGLYIEGEEYMKRICLSNYIYNRNSDSELTDDGFKIFNQKAHKRIQKIIVDKVNKYKIEISDVALENLATHVTIACKRIEEGFPIEQIEKHISEEYPFETSVANEIVKDVEAFTGLSFSEAEISYIIIHLVGTKLLHDEYLSEYSKLDEVENIVSCMLKRLQTELDWDFHNDHEFIQALTLHIRPAMNRLRYSMNIRNPLLNEIKIKYPTAFEGAVIASKCINNYLAIEVREHEIAYIALHIGVAMQRHKSEKRKVKRVIIVCATGVGSAKLLYYRLVNIFEHELEVVDTINYYKLEEYDLSSIDLIISTVPIKKDIGVPVHVVNTFLEDNDIINVKKSLSVSGNQDKVQHHLDRSRVFIKKEFDTKESVIQFLCEELNKQGLVPDNYQSLVLEREASAPTSFGNLVAIPHPSTPVTKNTFWTVCTLKRPIQWNANQMVQFVCLLNIKIGKKQELDKMYQKMISVMEDRDTIQQIISSNSIDEVMAILN